MSRDGVLRAIGAYRDAFVDHVIAISVAGHALESEMLELERVRDRAHVAMLEAIDAFEAAALDRGHEGAHR